MDTHSDRPEDLNDLERRLSAWQPSNEALDADAVLFAAGRAAVRLSPVRFVWPAFSAFLTVLSVVLALWVTAERSERQALARRLHEHPPSPAVNPSPAPAPNSAPVEAPSLDNPAPESYLASRRALEKGLDAWPSRVVVRSGPTDPSLTDTRILTVGQRDALLEP